MLLLCLCEKRPDHVSAGTEGNRVCEPGTHLTIKATSNSHNLFGQALFDVSYPAVV